ncbi:hypothetical protein SADUNF_Sadunf18G0024500 [Salix dunnii]|uniref:Uncharacterized protein n=1 Tax=Salix dunnii TaxID=1413687 RepID=A0A835J306_9ROSI|nr:hypothetical protein SADUNF_Sadunf18G0024500 [Salix dunnii]
MEYDTVLDRRERRPAKKKFERDTIRNAETLTFHPSEISGIFSPSDLHVKEILLKQEAETEAMAVIKSVLHQPWKSKSYCDGVSDSQAVREQVKKEITSCPGMKSICHSIFQIFSIQRSVGDPLRLRRQQVHHWQKTETKETEISEHDKRKRQRLVSMISYLYNMIRKKMLKDIKTKLDYSKDHHLSISINWPTRNLGQNANHLSYLTFSASITNKNKMIAISKYLYIFNFSTFLGIAKIDAFLPVLATDIIPTRELWKLSALLLRGLSGHETSGTGGITS